MLRDAGHGALCAGRGYGGKAASYPAAGILQTLRPAPVAMSPG